MPQLSAKKAKKVAKATSEYKLLDNGIYRFKLLAVETGEGDAGPYWRWDLQIPEGCEGHPRKLSHFTSLSAESEFKMKEAFEAFGASMDTHTDKLVGKEVLGEVVQRKIEKGNRAGQMGNNIAQLMSPDSGKKGKKSGKKGGKNKGTEGDDDPPF